MARIARLALPVVVTVTSLTDLLCEIETLAAAEPKPSSRVVVASYVVRDVVPSGVLKITLPF
jgi:hypothetical protein